METIIQMVEMGGSVWGREKWEWKERVQSRGAGVLEHGKLETFLCGHPFQENPQREWAIIAINR